MLYADHKPAPPLSALVQRFWYTKGYQAPHRFERVLPSGTIQLIINLAPARSAAHSGESKTGEPAVVVPMLIVGLRSEYAVIDTTVLSEVIGVQFTPGGSVPFFAAPADEFSNAHISLEDAWGLEACEFRDRLCAAPDPQSKFRILEQTLLARAARSRLTVHPAVEFAIKRFQPSALVSSVEDLTHEIGLSRRRFAQVFREQVGVTPKRYHRILRFQNAVSRIGLGHDLNWADVALCCGYFDQSHFINDFRAFSGINPTTYLARRTRWANHVPMDA